MLLTTDHACTAESQVLPSPFTSLHLTCLGTYQGQSIISSALCITKENEMCRQPELELPAEHLHVWSCAPATWQHVSWSETPSMGLRNLPSHSVSVLLILSIYDVLLCYPCAKSVKLSTQFANRIVCHGGLKLPLWKDRRYFILFYLYHQWNNKIF